jgi:anti-sigma factor RsiW
MIPPLDPISDADLNAYVDDQLDMRRRIEVEDHLAHHPHVAAQVMADLRSCDELRLAFPKPPTWPRIETVDAARRLDRGLASTRTVTGLRRLAAVAVLIAAGWFTHAELGALSIGVSVASPPPPAFVEDAFISYQTLLARAAMHTQPKEATYDADEIRATTAIVLPELPRTWRILDFEIFPSIYGPSVEMAIEGDGDLGTLSLFAVRPGNFGVVAPTLASKGSEAIAYWQMGQTAYALIGKAADGGDLSRAAVKLSETLYWPQWKQR